MLLGCSVNLSIAPLPSTSSLGNEQHSYDYSVQASIITRRGGGTSDENYGVGTTSCGDRVFIGSYTDSYHYMKTGAVYIYSLSSSGRWELDSKVHPSYISSDIYFGWSLACQSRDYVAVGAYADSSQGLSKAGAVYMYAETETRSSSSGNIVTSWQEKGVLYSENPQAHENFGWAVSVSENLMAVSAIGNAELFSECGVVYMYKYTAPATDDSRRRVLQHDSDNGEDVGGDEVSGGSPPGWQLEAVLSSPDPYPYMNFGWSVGLHGGVVVVGAPWMHSRRGEVYIYSRELTENSAYDDLYYMDEGEFIYTLEDSLSAASLSALTRGIEEEGRIYEVDTKSYFGHSVSIDGDVVVIGHYLGHIYNRGSDGDIDGDGDGEEARLVRTGSAYVCRLDSNSATNKVTLIANLGHLVARQLEEFSFFGYDVSVSGRTIVVGAPGDGHSNRNSSVFVFTAESDRRKWRLSRHWHGAEFAPSAPDTPAHQLAPSRFGVSTTASNGGGVVFASDSKGMSADYVQTGCVFSWVGIQVDEEQSAVMTALVTPITLAVGVIAAAFLIIGAIVWMKRRQRTGAEGGILGGDDNISMAIGTSDSEESSSFFFRSVSRIAYILRTRLSPRANMQMVSLPTESLHGMDSSSGGHSSCGDQASHSCADVDTRRLISTAQAVADDDKHPCSEEVSELIRSYRRDWISPERFQQEFQRLVF